MGEDALDGVAFHTSKRPRPGAPCDHVIRERLRAAVEPSGEVPDGDGFGGYQRGAPDVRFIQEELDDPAPGAPSGKDDGGGPKVGHGPLDVVLDEVGRGCGQHRLVPPEEHTFNGVGRGYFWGWSQRSGSDIRQDKFRCEAT